MENDLPAYALSRVCRSRAEPLARRRERAGEKGLGLCRAGALAHLLADLCAADGVRNNPCEFADAGPLACERPLSPGQLHGERDQNEQRDAPQRGTQGGRE